MCISDSHFILYGKPRSIVAFSVYLLCPRSIKCIKIESCSSLGNAILVYKKLYNVAEIPTTYMLLSNFKLRCLVPLILTPFFLWALIIYGTNYYIFLLMSNF